MSITINGSTGIDATTNDLGLNTSGTTDVVLATGGGSVGVGVASPSATLDVNGTIKLDGNHPVGTNNVALGDTALDSNVSGSSNTAIGADALTASTGNSNTAVGYRAGYGNTAGSTVAVGNETLYYNTATENSALGSAALFANTTGAYNSAVGRTALFSNTTASNSVAVGYQSLYSNTTSSNNTAVGYQAGYSHVSSIGGNTFIGKNSGNSTTSGLNTFVGDSAGYHISSGDSNTILGRYNGNQGGLDIRTSNNNIVISDGDGNPKLVFKPSSGGGSFFFRKTTGFGTSWTDGAAAIEGFDDGPYMLMSHPNGTTSGRPYAYWFYNNTVIGSITQNGTTAVAYNTVSDYRLKENVVELTGATDRLKQLEPKSFNFIADPDTTVDGFLAHEVQAIVPEAIHGTKDEVDAEGNPVYQGIDQSKLVPLLVATIKELEARITALESA